MSLPCRFSSPLVFVKMVAGEKKEAIVEKETREKREVIVEKETREKKEVIVEKETREEVITAVYKLHLHCKDCARHVEKTIIRTQGE